MTANQNVTASIAYKGDSSYHTTANIYAHLQKKSKNKLTKAMDSLLEIC